MRGTTRQLPAAFLALLALITSGLVVVLGAAAPAQAAPPRVCGGALDTGTDKVVLLDQPGAAAWTDYSIEGDATTSNTVAVSFRQNGNNGPSLQFSAGQNSLGPLRLNNGGWAADGTIALPAGTLTRGEQFHFRIDVRGQQLTVHVDDVQVVQYSRPWLPASGTIGVRVSGAETGTLDNLVVRSLLTEDEASTPTTSTTGRPARRAPQQRAGTAWRSRRSAPSRTRPTGPPSARPSTSPMPAPCPRPSTPGSPRRRSTGSTSTGSSWSSRAA